MSWSGCWREESICSATDPPLRRDITTCICAMRVPSLHSKQQRKCFPKVQLKCITLSWPHKSALLKHQLCQLATSWSHFGAIPTIHPWAVPLTLDPSYPHTHTRPTAIRALSRQPDDDVNTRCFIGFHYFLETQGPTGLQTCFARPPSGRSLPIYPNCPSSRKIPGPCVDCAPTPGLSGACSHWISGELEGGEPPRLRHCYCSEKNSQK